MRTIQFQTDYQYLCFNHAVKQVMEGDDTCTIWGDTMPKGKFEPLCMECTVNKIHETTPRGTRLSNLREEED